MTLHDVAARGFAAGGEVYEQGRPDYPAEAVATLVERLGIAQGMVVLDLGAGTGKLTRRLQPTGASLVAVEPVAAMRQAFARHSVTVPVVGGTAEALPFRSGVARAVVAGSSFHWFDGPVALREIHRVLRPGGRLGLVWLARDETVDWVRALVEVVDAFKQGDPPRYTDGSWRRAFEATASFSPLEVAEFPFSHQADRQTALARVASTSFVGALSAEARQEVVGRVKALLDRHPATRDRETLDLPYRADVYWTTRLGDG